MKCQTCGAEISVDAGRCPKCGARVAKPVPQPLRTCPRCGSAKLVFVDGVVYRCAKCGYEY